MVVQAIANQNKLQKQQGFTLIEVMISIVVAMVVLAGLMLTFTSQSNQYQYQNKRIDASQDLEFALKFIARDLRSALVGSVAGAPVIDIYASTTAPFETTRLRFEVWDAALAPATSTTKRVLRHYGYTLASKSIVYDRNAVPLSTREILPNVTLFKVFDDNNVGGTSRAGFSGIPDALPNTLVPDPANSNTPLSVPGYTILIEVEVPAGYKGGSLKDVRGNVVTTKRIWRYAQVYPMAAVQ